MVGGVLYAARAFAQDERIRADSVHYDRTDERAALAVVAPVLIEKLQAAR